MRTARLRRVLAGVLVSGLLALVLAGTLWLALDRTAAEQEEARARGPDAPGLPPGARLR